MGRSNLCTDEEFLLLWDRYGNARLIAQHLGASYRAMQERRRNIEKRMGIDLAQTRDLRMEPIKTLITHAHDKVRSIADISGSVIVFSDAHFYPGEPSLGYIAMIKLIKALKPKLIVANGDILDGSTIHSHGPNGWEDAPSLRQELDAVIDRMQGIQKAARGAILHRTIGNHDIRFDRRLASQASEYRDIQGMRLEDHLPEWGCSWSLLINDNTMIKHRINGGIHSGYNNTLKGGINVVTGHTHLLSVSPWSDYTGRRYGVSTGMLADPRDAQFRYAEDNPRPWCQGFAVLTYDAQGRLLPPELCEVVDGLAYFRGGVIA